MKNIAVIGGGPAGIMAAITAARSKQNVMLIEKNDELGKKLLISGNGRCNITNACPQEELSAHFLTNGLFLRDAFRSLSNEGLVKFFEEKGLKLKKESDGRVFPVTDKSSSVLNLLCKELDICKVKILTGNPVKEILAPGGKIESVKLKSGNLMLIDSVILATGGISYPSTGSTGDGFDISKKLGHTIIGLRPGLVPLKTIEDYPKKLEGLALSRVRMRFSNGKKTFLASPGDMIFTGSGISGPAVLTASGQVADWLIKKDAVFVDIDLSSAIDHDDINDTLISMLKLNQNKKMVNIIAELLPQRLAEVVLDISRVDKDKKANQLTAPERKNIAACIKSLRMNIAGTESLDKAMITRGGIPVKEIDPKTMASRLVKGLYFAGEIMDIDAETGGYNMQAAFSTGFLAGLSAARAA